ncbi:DsbA family protein [Caulobacter sp. NIBR2454]|uniref:DsbA family protein n=1 Tax=Caulobacter sp. NIBR2454 TaxID=3015996 RepID=UPI0022B60624|nr:DsbA family protein [Caulobacter sp. NIBR2454]
MRRTLFATVLTTALALSVAACGEPKVDQAFGEKVRAYLLENPEILIEMSQKLEAKQQAEANSKVQGALAQHRQALERDPRDFVANPNGKITVVEFFDYRCSFCKLATPAVVQLIKDNPDVRFVFKEFVIFGAASETAARAALGAKTQGKYLDAHGRFMAEKSLDAAAVDRLLAEAGADVAKAKADGQAAAVTQQLKDIRDLAVALGVDGTPAFFVGDTVVRGADMEGLKKAIAEAKQKAG